MKNSVTQFRRWIFLGLFLGSTLALIGCSTTESENLSDRPWNSPKGWETGLPSSINEGR
jgi:hypothetical protein